MRRGLCARSTSPGRGIAASMQAALPDDYAVAIVAIAVRSRAADRATYLQRPDLGRRLDPTDIALLASDAADLAIVVADGLSAVAIGDEIAATPGAAAVVVPVGERPGLSSPDSLGAYVSWAPRISMADAERNCVSNIRPPHGLGQDAAAARIAAILAAARDQDEPPSRCACAPSTMRRCDCPARRRLVAIHKSGGPSRPCRRFASPPRCSPAPPRSPPPHPPRNTDRGASTMPTWTSR